MKGNMDTYLFTLTPLEPFFFGTEKMGESGNKNDYYQKSTYYPQQTAILGMLRYLIGELNDFSFVRELIGEKSFDATNYTEANFGIINSISSVFIIRDNEAFLDSAFDEYLTVQFRKTENYYSSQSKKCLPIVKEYNVKDGLRKTLISKSGKSIPIEFGRASQDGVFSYQAKDGNEKSRDGKSKASGYYKYEFVQMNNSCFGFYATFLKNETIKEGLTKIVFLGGNRSPFRLSVVKKTESQISVIDLSKKNEKDSNYSKITLLSDTYLEPIWVEKSDFAITELIGFRNLQTSISHTKKWSGLTKSKRPESDQPYFSNRFNLLKKGSVLFFLKSEDCNEVCRKIDEYENFKQIGYNKYLTT